MTGTRDPRVEDYLRPLPAWQQDLCRRLRDLAMAADPEMQETIKRRVQPYYVLQGNVCALLATKDHVNLFLYDPLVPDPDGVITAGHDNKTGRTISFYADDPIPTESLTRLLRGIVANNRAGGWRRLRGRPVSTDEG